MSHLKQNFLQTAIFLAIVVISQGLFALETSLQFDEKGKFKIAQFTDMHFYVGGVRSPQVIENIRAVLEKEKPNLAILTGDIVTGSKENGES